MPGACFPSHLKSRRTQLVHRANIALGLGGLADLPAVQDQQVREFDPGFLGNDGHEVLGVNQVADHWRVVLRKKA